MKKIVIAACIAAFVSALALPASAKKANNGFPTVDQKGKIAIVCHRGWWKSEAAGNSENSIASLKAAQDAGFWGSECDIHLTADGIVMVNHDRTIKGKNINKCAYADFKDDLLPNGERRPTFDEYLDQTAKCRKTVLVVELKRQENAEIEDMLLDKTVAAIKAHGLYSPKRVLFITFSKHLCERVAKEYPKFINQFLTSDDIDEVTPDKIAAKNINGIDYLTKLFLRHPEWVKQAKDLGMSVNVWTVNKEDQIKTMIDLGVDAITTNEPDLVRQLLGKRELPAGK